MSIGGSVESISWFGRDLAVAADADGQRDLGGFTSEFQPNGDGTGRDIMTRKPWAIEGLSLSIDDDNGDQEFLQEKINSKQRGDFTVTFASGSTYQGRGKLTGDLKMSTQSVTAPVNFTGPGILTKQT